MARYGMRAVALVYLTFLLALPVGLIGWRTFAHGLGPVLGERELVVVSERVLDLRPNFLVVIDHQ